MFPGHPRTLKLSCCSLSINGLGTKVTGQHLGGLRGPSVPCDSGLVLLSWYQARGSQSCYKVSWETHWGPFSSCYRLIRAGDKGGAPMPITSWPDDAVHPRPPVPLLKTSVLKKSAQ